MIIDTLANADRYFNLAPRLGAVFAYLRSADWAALAPGRYDLAGDDAFALLQEYQTKPAGQGVWEAHRTYLDVQYVIRGVERMGYANIDTMTVSQPYDAGRDFVGFTGEGDFVTVPAGRFTIFLPQDVHMPTIAVGEPATVRKVVVKVRVG